jgi:hypothetical protein
MATEVNENTKLTLDLKTIGMVIAGTVSLASMWFVLQSDIAEAKELPAPEISRTEYDLKDELIRSTIMDTQDDVEEIKDKLDKIDERLYQIQTNR